MTGPPDRAAHHERMAWLEEHLPAALDALTRVRELAALYPDQPMSEEALAALRVWEEWYEASMQLMDEDEAVISRRIDQLASETVAEVEDHLRGEA